MALTGNVKKPWYDAGLRASPIQRPRAAGNNGGRHSEEDNRSY